MGEQWLDGYYEKFEIIAARDGGRRCFYCGAKKPLQIDHIIPRAKGGSDDIENLQLLCARCNRVKGVRADKYRAGAYQIGHSEPVRFKEIAVLEHDGLRTGGKVLHRTLGVGVVLQLTRCRNETQVQVHFRTHGTKTFIQSYARLLPIDEEGMVSWLKR